MLEKFRANVLNRHFGELGIRMRGVFHGDKKTQ